jgi:alpha-1,3-rhamnosyl/mannosyltransferase
VIAVSAATRADLLRHFRVPAERVVVIPEAVDAEFRPRPMEEVQAVRQRYHLPEHYLLYLGINKQHKNLVRLVEAYARLEPGVPALVLAGREDPRYPQARQRAAELGLAERVRFPGDIANADLPALYSGAMLFVFPSLYEGFGLPPLEAMACGTPVACSQASSLPEVVGEATLRFDPYDVEAIAQGLRQAVQDEPLRKHLGEAGVARAAQFTWERAARETMRVYDEVTG